MAQILKIYSWLYSCTVDLVVELIYKRQRNVSTRKPISVYWNTVFNKYSIKASIFKAFTNSGVSHFYFKYVALVSYQLFLKKSAKKRKYFSYIFKE